MESIVRKQIHCIRTRIRIRVKLGSTKIITFKWQEINENVDAVYAYLLMRSHWMDMCVVSDHSNFNVVHVSTICKTNSGKHELRTWASEKNNRYMVYGNAIGQCSCTSWKWRFSDIHNAKYCHRMNVTEIIRNSEVHSHFVRNGNFQVASFFIKLTRNEATLFHGIPM